MDMSRISKPGLVVAAAAVTVGLMATTTAAVAGQRGPNTSSSGAKVTGPGADVSSGDRYAVINADGSFARGKGVLSSTNLGTGTYEVRFNRNVASCAFLATVGSSAPSGTEPTGEITTVRRVGTTNGVFLSTHNSSGGFANRGFHLLVACPT